MKTDIIVVTYGNEELSKRCFRSIRKHTSGYRLIWVDNGSGRKSIEEVLPEASASAEMVPLWLKENVGFVRGVNEAIKLLETFQTESDNVVLLNNDVEVTEGWLDRMIRVFERDIKVKAVGPITSECKSWQSFLGMPSIFPVCQIPEGFEEMDMDARAKKMDYAYGELACKCSMLAFFCTVFRTEVFRELGFLDESFGVGYGDDDDFCKRMRDAKMEMAVSLGTYVHHEHQATFNNLFCKDEIAAMREQNLQVYEDKHGEKACEI